MSTEYKVSIFTKDKWGRGVHGHTVVMMQPDTIMVGLHDQCCDMVAFLHIMGAFEKRNYTLEMHQDVDGEQIYVFAPADAPITTAIDFWIRAMLAGGEGEYVESK